MRLNEEVLVLERSGIVTRKIEITDVATKSIDARRIRRSHLLPEDTTEDEVPFSLTPGEVFCIGKNLQPYFSARIQRALRQASPKEYLNKWREAVVMLCELESCNLSEFNLSGAILSGSNLQGAILKNCELSDAILQETCLVGADLSFSNLSGAMFPFANLKRANLSHSNLTNAIFEGADLKGTNLAHAVLDGASFYKADLTDANLGGASVRDVDFDHAIGVPDSVLRERQGRRRTAEVRGRKSDSEKIAVFYGTDRRKDRGAEDLEHYYSGEATNPSTLTLGSCSVSLPKNRDIGENPNPWIRRCENEKRHIVLRSITELSERAFEKELRETMQTAESPGEVLVFVHGYNVSFAHAARCLAQLVDGMGFHGVAVLYSWSSRHRLFRYKTDEDNIKLVRHTLAPLLRILRACDSIKRLHILAHSMGCRGILDTFRDLEDEAIDTKELILAAPDVAQQDFQQTISAYEKHPAEFLTLYTAGKDLALWASKVLSGFPRAGEARNLLVAEGIETIDASKVSGKGLRHSYFCVSRPVVTDLNGLIIGKMRPDKRPLRRAQLRGLRYWWFPG